MGAAGDIQDGTQSPLPVILTQPGELPSGFTASYPQSQNTPAMISGLASGTVIEDLDPDGDNLLEASGKLTVVDYDPGESYFKPGISIGTYGTLYINSWGNWSYAASNNLAAIQGLASVESVTDTVAVSSVDGTRHNVVITIIGVDDSGGIALSWTAPVEREDGSGISMAEIAGYRVYYGIAPGDYTTEVAIDSGSTMSVTLSNLTPGTYYIAVTTVDLAGRESTYSQEVARSI